MNKVKEFRIKLSKSVVEFARIMDYSVSFQRQLECGAKPASRKYITKFKKDYPEADINYIFFTN